MNIKHIALNISRDDEPIKFYKEILGFEMVKHFKLPAELSNTFFDVNKILPVYFYKRDEIFLEMFVYPDKINLGAAHLCLELTDREVIIEKCIICGYKVKRVSKVNKPDLVFIYDKTGNNFEIKEKESPTEVF